MVRVINLPELDQYCCSLDLADGVSYEKEETVEEQRERHENAEKRKRTQKSRKAFTKGVTISA